MTNCEICGKRVWFWQHKTKPLLSKKIGIEYRYNDYVFREYQKRKRAVSHKECIKKKPETKHKTYSCDHFGEIAYEQS